MDHLDALTLKKAKTNNKTTHQSLVEVDVNLDEYGLETRQLPPKNIWLLNHDILAVYLFDYTSYPKLKDKVAVEFEYQFFNNMSFYTFHENKNQQNLSYFLINATKIATTEPISFDYRVTATFTLNNKSKKDTKEYHTAVQVIDKYAPSRSNFQNFEEGFTMRMRSNDTNFTFPMDSDDIFGNNINNLTFKQIDQNSSEAPKINFKISPRVQIFNQSFYKRFEKIRLVKSLGIGLSSDICIEQRIDKPSLFSLKFLSYDMFGNVETIKRLIFIDLEIVSTMKLNTYTFIVTLNTENKRSFMVVAMLKMNPKDPLPLTRLFYPDYKLVYYETGGPLYSSSFSWRSIKKVSVYKLEKPSLSRGEDFDLFWEQKVTVYAIYLPDQSKTWLGEFSLKGVKSQLHSKFNLSNEYSNMTCKSIETFSRLRGLLGCELFTNAKAQSPTENTSIEVFINIQIYEKIRGEFTIIVEDLIRTSDPGGKHMMATCVNNFWHSVDSKSEEKYFIKPFNIIFHEEGEGYFMRSQSQEWIELIRESEIEEGLILKNTICQENSKKLILEFQKELKIKKTINQELTNLTWSKSVTYFLSMDSKYRANDRVFEVVEKEVPFSQDTSQVYEVTYLEASKELVYGISGRVNQYRQIYYRMKIDFSYPRVTLSTNSTENFTANLKIFLNPESATREGAYGFPFKIQAETTEEFEIEPKSESIALRNGKHNLEEYFEIKGPMNSMQQVTTNRGRLRFSSRCFSHPTIETTLNFLYIKSLVDLCFIGINNNRIYIFDNQTSLTAEIPYTQTIRSITTSCCSSTRSLYALHYNPDLQNSLSVRRIDILKNNQKVNKLTIKGYRLKYIDYRLVSKLYLASSKMFLKSVADGVLAMCVSSKSVVKVIILEFQQKENPVVSAMRDITTRTTGRRTAFVDITIVSIMTKIHSLRALAVILTTKSHIITQYLQYKPSETNPATGEPGTTMINIPTIPTTLSLNGSINYIKCSKAVTQPPSNGTDDLLIITSNCHVVINNYLMKTLIFSAKVTKTSKNSYNFSNPKFNPKFEYEIPRFYKVLSLQDSEDYIAVHAINKVDSHQEIFVFKKGWRPVWASTYASAEMTTSYDIGRWVDGRTRLYINEYGSNLKLYWIGNMTMEVLKGFNATGELNTLYSVFERPSDVVNFRKDFRFLDKEVKEDGSIFWFINGWLGGFLLLVIILWGFWRIWVCFDACLRRRFGKRERRWTMILVKKSKSRRG